jgi:drug/metabolite transporter (DMT)-like permease
MLAHSPDRALRYRGIFLIVLGVTLFGVMDGLGKLLGRSYPVDEVIWARYAFALPVVLATMPPRAWPTLLRCERPWLQGARALLPLLASATVIIGLSLLPLADATAISFASPLLVVILSAPLLRERVSVETWIGVLSGFVGILIIARPGAGALAAAALLPLGTALFFALYQVLTRLVSRGDDPAVTLAWTIGIGFAVATPALALSWQQPATGQDWLLMGISGLLFGFGQLLLIHAFSIAPASFLTPFTYAQIVAATAFGALVFDDIPDRWTLIGTAIVILSGVYVLHRQPG